MYAGFWRRLLAFTIDSLLYSVLVTPILIASYGREYFYWSASHGAFYHYYGIGDVLLTKLLPIALILLFWTRWGATPGKLLLDIRIVDARNLRPIGFKKAMLRLLGYAVSFLTLYLGFLWIAWDKRKQGLHDKIAETLVIRNPEYYENKTLPELMSQFK